ncbi:putative methylmalonyl-CoA mutase, small subunit [Leptospira ryugenii]|uniref:Putative methylmalonyl-CoA mutase, small subunit n=1 Tax=Leptospira ryugenii TaxID=1917863 RepID=A0A2P2E4P8_9LEPT|nr:methylmalonyl-CoA mutase family protein [Leptospira ryugenii]GBF51849.1 putative methylmalonyl-CoA mutase, small subunit [Leptospira ryugenii]
MEEKLFAEFAPIASETWIQTITKDLKGLDYSKVRWQTEDGFIVEPFYSEAPVSLPDIRRAEKSWKITEFIPLSKESTQANLEAKQAIQTGAEAIVFSLGSEIKKLEDLIRETTLGIDTKLTPLLFTNLSPYLKSVTEWKSFGSDYTNIHFDIDPFVNILSSGDLGLPKSDLSKHLYSISLSLPKKSICVHSHYLRDAGASISQELSFALAWGHEYLQMLVSEGQKPKLAAESIWFWMGIGSDYFSEIAKIRAFRILWAQILEQYETGLGESTLPTVLSQTSTWNYTAYDPYVNMLRGTTEAMSAVLGGSDFVAVLPFDTVEGATEFGKRIARNSQLLLRHESHLDKVHDPSSGSYYIENLTHQLAETAWKSFQTWEAKGGFFIGIQTGEVQKEVLTSASQKRDAVATKKQTLLGSNQYPLASERHPKLPSILANGKEGKGEGGQYPALPIKRLSFDLDRLRSLTDARIAQGKSVPKVFLLSIGDLTMRKARAGFSANFIGCLGYEILEQSGFSDLKDGVKAAKDAKADLVVLCSSDEEYATLIPEFGKLLKEQIPSAWPLVAGYPKDLIEVAAQNGISEFIHLKRNLIEFMEKAQARL